MVFKFFSRRDEQAKPQEGSLPLAPVNNPGVAASDFEMLGPILWQDIRFGMSLSEVRAIRPEVQRPTDDSRLADGTMAELEIPRLRLADHDYRVLIYARAGRVVQVTISTLGGATQRDFQQLTGALRLRYGQEVEMKEDPGGFSTAEWLSPEGINVSLVCFSGAGILNVVFQNSYSETARQL